MDILIGHEVVLLWTGMSGRTTRLSLFSILGLLWDHLGLHVKVTCCCCLADLFHAVGMKKGVDVVLDLSDGSVNKFDHVRGDRKKLRQILSNIVSNAVKFTSQVGHPVENGDLHVGVPLGLAAGDQHVANGEHDQGKS